MNDMNISALLALEQTGDPVRAADKLCKTPQAILYNIRRLEEELSLPLVSGSGQNLQLTSAGRQFCDLFRQMEQQLSFAKLHLPGKNAAAELCIGHDLWGGMPQAAVHAVQTFAKNNPQLRLHARCISEKELPVLLETGSIDLLLLPRPAALAFFPEKDCIPVLDLTLYKLTGVRAEEHLSFLYTGENLSAVSAAGPSQACPDWDSVYTQVALGRGWTLSPKNERIAASPLFRFSAAGETVTLCALCLHPEKPEALALTQHLTRGGTRK